LIRSVFSKYFELVFWTAALISLGLTNPGSESHFTLCPLKSLGFTWCPGCGMGHAISFLLRGDIKSSIHAHWLGIPAVIVILHRIYVLGKQRLMPATTFPDSKAYLNAFETTTAGNL
jgi:hypothetical protein